MNNSEDGGFEVFESNPSRELQRLARSPPYRLNFKPVCVNLMVSSSEKTAGIHTASHSQAFLKHAPDRFE
jgi:hypothetical protein